jgi:hypothetical protein
MKVAELLRNLNEEKDDLSFLKSSAKDLDLSNPEDRAIFRGKVQDRLKNTTVEAMQEWIGSKERNRAKLVRAIADEFIKNSLP